MLSSLRLIYWTYLWLQPNPKSHLYDSLVLVLSIFNVMILHVALCYDPWLVTYPSTPSLDTHWTLFLYVNIIWMRDLEVESFELPRSRHSVYINHFVFVVKANQTKNMRMFKLLFPDARFFFPYTWTRNKIILFFVSVWGFFPPVYHSHYCNTVLICKNHCIYADW